MTVVRHLNRGDVKDGGCAMCKPRHRRADDIVPVRDEVEEGLHDLDWWDEIDTREDDVAASA